MAIDKSYMEKLGEIIHDEKKAVNYKTVSIAIGVHVNIAKQMLYHMYKTSKAEGKKIFATYYISGMVQRKTLLKMEGNEKERTSDENASEQLPSDHLEAYLVSVCREKDLEDVKSKYSKIFSIHIYSLSAFPIENYDVLENLVEFPMKDSEGRTPVDFGPIICSASQKLRGNDKKIRSVPISNSESKSKSDEVNKTVDSKKQEKKNGDSNSENRDSQETSRKDAVQETKSQKPANVTTEKKDANRLKSMFATASTKPKSQAKKVEISKPDVKQKEIKENSKVETKKTKSFPSESKDKETRKRKRIRDVLSSDSEEDEKISENEEGSSPESPVPRKRIQIESDSDDDFKQTPKKKEEPSPVKEKDTIPGRKRVAKMISKSFVDKDGFLVTTKEQVMVSEDEDNEQDEKQSKIPDSDTLKPSVSDSATKKPSQKTPVKAINNSGKNAPGKTKQASLMSFFQKK